MVILFVITLYKFAQTIIMGATANTIRLINELRPVEFLYLVINLSKASYPDVLQMRTEQIFV